MGKTRAEIQKAYRERKKASESGQLYLARERERVKRYYVNAANLSISKRTKRNSEAKLRNRLSRLRKKYSQENNTADDETSGYGSAADSVTDGNMHSPQPSTSAPMIVKMDFKTPKTAKSTGPKVARKRALARTTKLVTNLRSQIRNLQRRLKVKSTQLHRLRKKSQSPQGLNTPCKQTDAEVNALQLTPKRREMVKKKILLSNVMLAELKDTRLENSRKASKSLHNIIAGRIARKYRCISSLSRSTGLSRNSLGQTKTKLFRVKRESRMSVTKRVSMDVQKYFEREDNSRVQPGKADVKTENKAKTQTVVLTDYLKNLHQKFLSEQSHLRISLASFCRLRPKHVLLASFTSRNACQCTRHQNMAHKIKTLRKLGVKISENPECLTEKDVDLDQLLSDLPEMVSFKLWKKVELENGKLRMSLTDQTLTAEEFKAVMKKETQNFREHVHRVKEQYKQIRCLKQILPHHEMILQMDFAENFACRSLNEVQSAYWNQTSVTLHPIVVYFKKTQDSDLEHKSFVIISDELSHSASTVCAFIDAIIPFLKNIDPDVKMMHYWTDSPTSQYRNRCIFHTIAEHHRLYVIAARWNYFEAGHGKGPCDGLGGCTKRMADEAIRLGNAIIQDAADFFKWAVNSSMKGVNFVFVPKRACEEKTLQQVDNTSIKAVKNTLTFHAVGCETGNILRTRKTSCYCDMCILGEFCSSWSKSERQPSVNLGHGNNPVTAKRSLPSTETDPEDQVKKLTDLQVGQFVAAVYDNVWYVGKIEGIDPDDGEYHLTFMEKAKNLFRWPAQSDELWVSQKEILCELSPLKPTGKSCRHFVLPDRDRLRIENLFELLNK